jgi:MoxR-like ATPase
MEKIKLLYAELDKVIAGYKDVKIKVIHALLADGHVLLESVPGLAKTTLIAALQAAIANSKKARIQMTMDLKPSDIVGGRIFNLKTGEFEIATGPVIGVNLLLADEINRATPKAQGALLEAMQERKVTIAGHTFSLEDPFLVLATMNPIEQEGTYPLPEAQLDRFCFKLILDYVSREDEIKILENTAVHGRDAQNLVTPVISAEEIVALRKQILANVKVSRSASEYIVDLVRATRPKDPLFKKLVAKELTGKVRVGASPRAQIWIRRTAQVKAALSGRDFVTPDDVKYVAKDVMRHRILLTDEAAFDGFTTDMVVDLVLSTVPVIEPKTK